MGLNTLRRVDDRTFVAALQAVDRAISKPWFMAGAFVGASMLTRLAAALHLAGLGALCRTLVLHGRIAG